MLKDLSYNAGFDGDFALNNSISLFAEYSYERYYKSMASRYRVPGFADASPSIAALPAMAATAPTTIGAARPAISFTSLPWAGTFTWARRLF